MSGDGDDDTTATADMNLYVDMWHIYIMSDAGDSIDFVNG